MYRSGMNFTQIGKFFGIRRKSMARILIRHGIVARVQKQVQPLVPKSKARKLYNAGLNITEVSNKLGFNRNVIYRVLKKEGVKFRIKGGRPWARKRRGFYRLGTNGRWFVRDGTPHGKLRAVYRMEKKIGKPVPKGWCVHHKDENPQNDAIENLELKTIVKHSYDHRIKAIKQRKESVK